MKTITLPVYKRADRLRKTLECLKACEPSGYTLYVQAEPDFDEVVSIAKAIDWIPVSLKVNGSRLGLNANIKTVLWRAMSDGSEFNIALEDDLLLSKDAVRLADWFKAGPVDQYACMGFCAFKSDASRPGVIRETQDFRSWGYCFGKSSWQKYFVPALEFRYNIDPTVKHQDMWDFWVQFYLVMNGIPTIHPVLSRSNHAGIDDGTNSIPEIKRYFDEMVMSDGSFKGPYTIEKLPESIWEHARKLSAERLKAAV